MLTSLRGHLILGSILWIIIGTAISGGVLALAVREIVTQQLAHEVDEHLRELAMLVRLGPDGAPMLARPPNDARFADPDSGLYWQIAGPDGRGARAPSLGTRTLPLGAMVAQSEVADWAGGPLHLAQSEIVLPGQVRVRLAAAFEDRLMDEALRGLDGLVLASLGVVAVGLVATSLAQIVLGLQPLARIGAALAAVRAGRAGLMPKGLPAEVAPLAGEINALIAANLTMVTRARTQAGNLAHALKTPLAVLMDEGERLIAVGKTQAGQLVIDQCVQMQRQIDYQMARTRAAAQALPNPMTLVDAAVRPVATALIRLHRDRAVAIDILGDDRLAVACDAEDFSEIVGNLLDNAAKWARSRVRVTAAAAQGRVTLVVEDDGSGIPPKSMGRVFGLGVRLDEQVPGSGLGLTITQDLVTLYGGTVRLGVSDLGGLAVTLDLPAAGPRG